jgi:hypothetical protein
MKLKYKDIKTQREHLLTAQNMTCALCGDLIQDDAVLDHDHKTGFIRKVLHRGCNSMLGKIENAMPRSKITVNRLEVIAGRLIEYIKTQHTEYLHPTYKTKEEKMQKKINQAGRGMGRGKGKKPPKR